jgi:hypothetical protein
LGRRGPKKGTRLSGRRKGTPNRLTRLAREAIELAFEGIGGVEALTAWARKNRGVFYQHIYTKLLPMQVNVKSDVTVSAGAAKERLVGLLEQKGVLIDATPQLVAERTAGDAVPRDSQSADGPGS